MAEPCIMKPCRQSAKRKRVEEVFGWMKTVLQQRKRRFRELDRVGWMFTLRGGRLQHGADAESFRSSASISPGRIVLNTKTTGRLARVSLHASPRRIAKTRGNSYGRVTRLSQSRFFKQPARALLYFSILLIYLAPQFGYVSNFRRPVDPLIEPVDADCLQTDRCEALTRVCAVVLLAASSRTPLQTSAAVDSTEIPAWTTPK
jgi:hypothetical protein